MPTKEELRLMAVKSVVSGGRGCEGLELSHMFSIRTDRRLGNDFWERFCGVCGWKKYMNEGEYNREVLRRGR